MYEKLASMPLEVFEERRKLADLSYLVQGITFTVYSDGRGHGAPFPLRSGAAHYSALGVGLIERGLAQRVMALNLYLQDIYGQQRILKDRMMPRNLVYSCKHFRREMVGLSGAARHLHPHLAASIWCGIRAPAQYLVLEDNARSPSGISYVLENRLVMRRTFPRAFEVLRSAAGGSLSRGTGADSAQPVAARRRPPVIVLLTPGLYNSAYFEHCFLAQEMGIELVEGRDLVVADDVVYMKTIHGLTRVDVIYRRVDDDFLDPLAFRADSLVGVPGLMNAYRAGNIALANAVGTGVADDKAIYAYVPEFIRYYLGEDPILQNVETYLCSDPTASDLRAGSSAGAGGQGRG